MNKYHMTLLQGNKYWKNCFNILIYLELDIKTNIRT